MIRFVDTHSHIHDSEFAHDRDAVLANMRKEGIATIAVGTDLESSKAAVALAEKEDIVFACVGVHPTESVEDFSEIERLAENPRVVAIGECGLDYFRIPADNSAEKNRQKELFLQHIRLSQKTGKPLMIHSRPKSGTMDANEEILDILEGEIAAGRSVTGNAHFFTASAAIADRFLAIGFTLSIPGVITFAREYDEVIRNAPLSTLLSETDSPYAAPLPYRGKRNEPAYVPYVVSKIAEIRNEAPEAVSTALCENAKRVFKLPI